MQCWCDLQHFFEENSKGIVLRVRLTPNSSCCKKNGFFVTPEGEVFLKISVISVPEKGKANKELIAYLAKNLKIAKSDVEILSGELDRYKKILLKAKTDKVKESMCKWLEEAE